MMQVTLRHGFSGVPVRWSSNGFSGITSPPNYSLARKPYYPARRDWMRGRMATPIGSRFIGLGQPGTGQMIALGAPSIAGMTVASLAAAKVGWAVAAIPIVGPILAGVTLGLSALFARKGPRQRVATTEIVNKVEPLLQQNLQGYLSSPRNRLAQTQALPNFDARWQFVVEHCAIPEMGNPGRACIADRDRGGQFDWFAAYRNPIANDPDVQPDPTLLGSGLLTSLFPSQGDGAGPSSMILVLAAALIFGGLFIGGRSK
jgi:hypothetical protein